MTATKPRPNPRRQRLWSLTGAAGSAFVCLLFGLSFSFAHHTSSLIGMILGGLLLMLNLVFALKAHRIVRRSED